MKRFLVFIAFFISLRSSGQQFRAFTPIESSNGLSENSVRSINQLPDGRIIVITEGMVNLYNGTTFSYIHVNDEHSYPLTGYLGFHHMYVENGKRLWIKNRGRLMLIDIAKERYEENPKEVLESIGVAESLSDFFMDADKNLWMITGTGKLLYYNKAVKHAVVFLKTTRRQDNSDPIYDIAVVTGKLYIFYRSGLVVVYDLASRKELWRQNTLEGQSAGDFSATLYVVQDHEDLYLLKNGAGGGIMLACDGRHRRWNKVIQTNYWLNTLAVSPAGEIIVTCKNGLWIMDQNLKNIRLTPTLHLVDGSLIDIEVSSSFFDLQGGLWLGTLNKGLLYHHPDRFRFRNVGKSLFPFSDSQELYITSFAEDRNKDLLVGTDKGIFRYSETADRLSLYDSALRNLNCRALYSDKKDNIWVATTDGLFMLTPGKTRHYPVGDVNNILLTGKGDFYLSTRGSGLLLFDPISGRTAHVPVKKSDQDKFVSISQVIEYKGTLFGIANDGLFFYDLLDKELKAVNVHQHGEMLHVNNQQYTCLLADSRGLLWMGTKDGLNVWDEKNKKLFAFHTENGLINNVIKSITEDRQGSIWVSTANGVSDIRVSNDSVGMHFNFASFNRYDGVINNEFVQQSAFLTRKDELLLGGIDGFNKTDLHKIFISRKKFDPVFVSFDVFGKEIKPGDIYEGNKILDQSISATSFITLKHDQNFVGVSFSGLNFINPSQTYYKYFLEGVDISWHEILATDGIGRATYTNIAPGTYTLKVQATDNAMTWSGKTAVLKIKILPPWWETSWMITLYIITAIGLIYLVISYYNRKNKVRQEKIQQQKLNELKFNFFTNMSHELRTPLTLILTPLEVILKKIEDNAIKAQLAGVYRNAQSLLNLVNQLLNFRRLELSGEVLHLNYCDLNEFLELLCQPFTDLAADRGIAFETSYPQDLRLNIDKDKFGMMLNNLLSNAFKFTPDQGTISLKVEHLTIPGKIERAISISVSDSGLGIPEKDIPLVFERFFQGTNYNAENTGSGIGLHLVQEYAKLHQGFVEVKSESGKGSTFTINIPSDLKPDTSEKTKIHPDEPRPKNAISILIAEDNVEFRTFLGAQLDDTYDVVLASNGKEAMDMILPDPPDLVISDIMMPQMNGLELCDKLKKDIRTSHIPVILLTARSSDEAQFEGYKARADAYITKPFNIDILFVRIRNLIEQQEQRKQLFKKAIVIQPDLVTTSEIDERLVKRALECVEKNLDNEFYSVEHLSSDMNMERSGLYRKLVNIIGQTPSVFIRSVRLKKAAQLLAQREFSVAEISEKIGFSNPAYFSKCFQEEFNIKPSHYADHVASSQNTLSPGK